MYSTTAYGHVQPTRKERLREGECDGCPQQDVKIVIDDMNAQVKLELIYRPIIEPNSMSLVNGASHELVVGIY